MIIRGKTTSDIKFFQVFFSENLLLIIGEFQSNQEILSNQRSMLVHQIILPSPCVNDSRFYTS